jgi:flagellar basal body-associated protein FliL
MEENAQNENRKKSGLLWILIALLAITNGVTFWMYMQEKNKAANEIVVKEQVIVERDNVKSDLLQLQKDFDNLQTNDKGLQAEIEAKKAEIAQLLVDAEKHKGDAYIISKLRKESETLRQIMRGYVRTIDSLGTLNKTLIVEKDNVLKELDSEKGKTTTLNKEKEVLSATIQKGSILSCSNVMAKGVKFKSGGKKESETTKASRVQKIKVSFTLGENKIARAGEKTVFVRIVTPDGKEMAKNYDDNYRFTFDKSSGYFAGKQALNYANTEISGVTYCEGKEELVPGNYIIEVSCDGVIIGGTSLRLD